MNNSILIYAFRYALGRSTYAVADVAEEIRYRRHALSASDRRLIIDEIDNALAKGDAGMQIDRNEWYKTREVLEAVNADQ